MQLGMIGLGRMGSHMVQRLMKAGHECVIYDTHPEAMQELAQKGREASSHIWKFVQKPSKPRAMWLMVPAAAMRDEFGGHLEKRASKAGGR